jgi:Family of unknown function (DUF6111)
MIRPLLIEIGIFLIPFVAYALFVIATRRGLFDTTSWPLPLIGKLVIASLLLVITSLVLLANFSGAPPGSTYTPAHVENGKLIPGSKK